MFDVKVKSYTPKTDKRNIASFRKEKYFTAKFALIDLDLGVSVMQCLIYRTATTSYCVTWINGTMARDYARGYDKAGGGGYHKDSAAMDEALSSCGVELVESIHGRGEGAMKDALMAIAGELGIARPMVHYSHA